MKLKPYQIKIINLYLEQELLLSKIYRLFSEKYERYKDFWLSISREEIEHAGWVKQMGEYAKNEKAQFDEGKTRTYTLSSFIDYLKKIIKDIKATDMGIEKAFSISLDIEKSMIEKKVFHHFSGDSREIMRILEILHEGTIEHIDKLEKLAATVNAHEEEYL